jgi:hypothetical protein
MTLTSSCALPDLENADAGTIMDYFQSYLQQVVTLHFAMFQKLLFEADGVPLELAELFEDAGNTYLNISESISRHHLQHRLSEIEEKLDPGIEPALRRVEAQFRRKPRVRRAKHLTQPVKD